MTICTFERKETLQPTDRTKKQRKESKRQYERIKNVTRTGEAYTI